MQLYLVRHGQSENNLLWDNSGSDKGRSDDPLLTDVGHKQAARVAQFLSQPLTPSDDVGRDPQNVCGFGISHVYTSLMIRAMQTGYAIAQALGLPLIALKDLHETGGIYLKDEATGEFIQRPGKNRAYFAANFPGCILSDEARTDGWWNRPNEALDECLPRAQRALRTLFARHGETEDRIVVVTHGSYFNFLMVVLLKMPDSALEANWLVMNNVAITRVDVADERVVLAYLNRVDFLPRELIT